MAKSVSDYMKQVWPSLVVSIVVGMFASYLTATKAIAEFSFRIAAAESDIVKITETHERDKQDMKASLSKLGDKMENLRVDVAKGDAKLDVLIGRQ